MTTPTPTLWSRKLTELLSHVDDAGRRVDLQAMFDERAGICEFDGGMSRVRSEQVAYGEVVNEMASMKG